jgi:energy-coupling factor transport system ATP-binding protein
MRHILLPSFVEVPVKLVLDNVAAERLSWSLAACGVFVPGVHLVSGDVGCGKSTLALFMAGLRAPDRGTVIREGIRSTMLSFQFPEFHVTGFSVAEECVSWGLAPEVVLRQAGIEVREKTPVMSLSRGELKRLHLACILSRKYDLLLLDEPFSSLDCPGKEEVCRQISARTSGITIIFTHEQSVFPKVDHIWEISGGNLCDCGLTPGALARWQHAPPLIQRLVKTGRVPDNITPEDIQEAACRIPA